MNNTQSIIIHSGISFGTSGARGFVALDVAYALRSVIELFVVVSESARTDDVDLCSLFTVVG